MTSQFNLKYVLPILFNNLIKLQKYGNTATNLIYINFYVKSKMK